MKRSPIKRTKPMCRLPARRIAKRVADRPYIEWLHRCPCVTNVARCMSACEGPIQAAHVGRKPGMGLKCPDTEAVPLCLKHHAEFDGHSGWFKGWAKSLRRSQADLWIEVTRRNWEFYNEEVPW